MNLMARNKRDERMRSEGRAEVLSSFICLLDGFIPEGYPSLIALYRTTIREQLKLAAANLPPAAKDLEKLLREEREKPGNILRELMDGIALCTANHHRTCRCPLCSAVEKARASEGKG